MVVNPWPTGVFLLPSFTVSEVGLVRGRTGTEADCGELSARTLVESRVAHSPIFTETPEAASGEIGIGQLLQKQDLGIAGFALPGQVMPGVPIQSPCHQLDTPFCDTPTAYTWLLPR